MLWLHQMNCCCTVLHQISAVYLVTFLSDAFIPRHQSQSHHLWPGAVDLQLFQLWVLLYIFLCWFRLYLKKTKKNKHIFIIKKEQTHVSYYSPKHTEHKAKGRMQNKQLKHESVAMHHKKGLC